MKPFADVQAKSAGFANRLDDATGEIDRVLSGPDGKMGTADDVNPYQWDQHLKGSVPGVGNSLINEEFQQVMQAQRNWVSANLRLESGAAIPPEEMEREIEKYFPVFGDRKEAIAQKTRARATAMQNLIQQSQGAYEALFGGKGGQGGQGGDEATGQDGIRYKGPEMSSLPNPGKFAGKRFRDHSTGKFYKSNGLKWKEVEK